MHIKLDNNDGESVATVCVDRQTKHCQVIHSLPELIGQVTAIARSTGIPRLYVIVNDEDEAEEYASVGFQDTDKKVMVREFNG
jgi:N-acetylglutamate synthase-like GNAT family acetyltransferase